MQKIGLFFGSFNPIHMGHLIVAQHMQQELKLDKVLFVVSPQNPFKSVDVLWPEEMRLKLVQEAIADNPFLEVTDIEFGMNKPSYTYLTLALLEKNYPNSSFCLIMGSDNLSRLNEWRSISEILAKCKIEVYKRPHSEAFKIEHENIRIHKTPLIEISASFIRKRLAEGHSVRYLVPEKVIHLLGNYGAEN